MDPLTIGAVTGLAFLSEKVAEKVLVKLVGEGVDKTWAGREKLAAIFRKYAYGELQTLELSEEYTPDKKTIRGEIDINASGDSDSNHPASKTRHPSLKRRGVLELAKIPALPDLPLCKL